MDAYTCLCVQKKMVRTVMNEWGQQKGVASEVAFEMNIYN